MSAAVAVNRNFIPDTFRKEAHNPFLPIDHREGGIAVIGSGFCGTVATIHLLNLHRREVAIHGSDVPVLRIDRFDGGNGHNIGNAYIRCDGLDLEGAFLLTQPAGKMSPFASDTEDFSGWLDGNSEAFGTRSQYAQYLQSRYIEAITAAAHSGARFEIPHHLSRAEGIIPTLHGHLVTSDKALHAARAVVVALGHPKKNDFSHLKNTPGNLEQPFDPIEYLLHASKIESAENAILIGGGPTTLDAVQALEISGFRGQYNIISTAPAGVWLFEPRIYLDPNQPSIKFTHLDPLKIKPETTYRELRLRLNAELVDAHKQGHAFGHVIYQLPLDALWSRFVDAKDQGGIDAFVRYIIFLRGAATSPQSFALNRRLIRERRLRYFRTRADASKSSYDNRSDTFHIECESRGGKRTAFVGDIFANCAQFARRADVDPNFQSFIKQSSALQITSRGLIESEGNHGVYVVGPSAQPKNQILRGGWGVESFRDEVKTAAESAYRRWRELV